MTKRKRTPLAFLVTIVAATLLAWTGCDNELDITSEDEEALKAAAKVTVQASVNPATAIAGTEIVVTLTVTSSRNVTTDVALRITNPDGSLGYTTTRPNQVLVPGTPVILEEAILIEPTDPPGTYSVGARVTRSGSTSVLYNNGSLATFVVTGTAPEVAPTVTTSAATGTTSSGATLNGSANPNGSAATGWFRYDTANPGTCNDTFGTRAPASGGSSLGSSSSSVSFSQALMGLAAGTTYYFCAIASNASGTGFGPILSFATPSASGSPDLVVTQIALSPSSPNAGNAVTFSATVKNQGTGATPAGTTIGVLFSVDGTPVTWSDNYNQALAAGATVTLSANGGPSGSATWTATSGSHQVVGFVDDVNRIPNESNESNNQLTRSFTVGTVCTPACPGKVCGPDGCGGSCGTCGSGQTCNASGQCAVASTLPPLWNASPPTSVSPAPSGPVVGLAGQFDTGTLATNEVWDNFNGPAGSNPDSRLWLEDTINQGGTQVYDPARSFLDGNGNAVLEAIQSGSTIFSGRFTSRTKFNMQYGWCAARIKFPKAGASWFPAFWLLLVGYNYSPYGEIDIMEFFGDTTKYNTHIHFGGSLPSLSSIKSVPASHSGGNAGDGFHTYWMQWEPDRIRIGVDDLIMGDWGPTSVPAGAWDHMRQPFYFITNFAVAPPWLPAPNPSDFPARMEIDWIWYKPL
jgi:hypothetical protein